MNDEVKTFGPEVVEVGDAGAEELALDDDGGAAVVDGGQLFHEMNNE